MDDISPDRASLKKKIADRLFMVPLIYAVLLFLPAGTFDYWQADAYFAVNNWSIFFQRGKLKVGRMNA